MREIASEVQINDCLCDKSVIQFLSFVDVVAAGIAAGVKVSDPSEVVADVTHDIAIHDLRVIDVV